MSVMTHLAPRALALGGIRLYQATLSRWLPRMCRFEPSCSRYAAAVIERQGVIVGSARAVYRIARCNPLSAGGYDPPYPDPETAPS